MNTVAAVQKNFSDYAFQPVIEPPCETNKRQLDRILLRLNQGKKEFACLSIDQRINLLESIHSRYIDVAKRSVQAACAAKGIEFERPLEGEEWISGPLCVLRHLRLLKESLEQIKRNGITKIQTPVRIDKERLKVPIFPAGLVDKALYKDVVIDMHLLPGVTEKDLERNRASFYQEKKHDGKLALVLGAGTISAIPIMDVLTKMFNEGKACILKMNPVNAYLGYFIEEAFKGAIENNYLAVVYGRIEQAKYLLNHPEVDEIHLTGSNKTHDYIYWGAPGPDRMKRMAQGNPLLSKPSTSALGNISPVIVYPGEYKKEELRYQAESIASSLSFNSGFMCSVPVVLVTSRDWPQRDMFLQYLENELDKLEPRRAYYPGAQERWSSLLAGDTGYKLFGQKSAHATQWAFLRNLSPDDGHFSLYKEEPFCTVFSETAISAGSPDDFLGKAVRFANKMLWGTLTASIIIDPRSAANKHTAEQLELSIQQLKYGTVAINSAFTALSFITATAAWGAYPGSTMTDIQSGRGWVHNTSMVEGIEKMVARFPISSSRKPFYFNSHKKKLALARKLIDYEVNQSWNKIPSILLDVVFA